MPCRSRMRTPDDPSRHPGGARDRGSFGRAGARQSPLGRPARPGRVPGAVVAVSLVAGLLSGGASAAAATRSTRPLAAKPLVSSSRCAANQSAGTITYLTGFGWQASVGILDPIAADAQGYYSEMCLRVQFRPGNGDPTSSSQLVAAGRATITELGSPSDAITAAAGGIPVDAVATYGNTTASTLLTMPSITNLRQLDGKTIGYKGAMPPIITAMLEKAGVDIRSLKEVSVGYDPTILPRGQVQGLTAYKSNEPIELKDDGYKVREWDPGSFGLNGAFNVFDVNRAWATAHAGAMEDFLRATFEAYRHCLAHASSCVNEAARYQVAYPVHQNIQRWGVESGEVNSTLLPGRGVGYEDQAQWDPEYKLLLADHLIRHPVALGTIINPAYVDAIYHGRSLIWPGP
jgi:ABC-type nitrate/sulfonate/bicarbonate transport system substrate-binding protein